MYKDGMVYRIDVIKLAKERCKRSNGGNGNYKDYLWINNKLEFEIFNEWSTFMYKGFECDYCEIKLESGYIGIPFCAVKEVNNGR